MVNFKNIKYRQIRKHKKYFVKQLELFIRQGDCYGIDCDYCIFSSHLNRHCEPCNCSSKSSIIDGFKNEELRNIIVFLSVKETIIEI